MVEAKHRIPGWRIPSLYLLFLFSVLSAVSLTSGDTPARGAGRDLGGPAVTPTATIGVCQVWVTGSQTNCDPPASYPFSFNFRVYSGWAPQANLTFYFEVAAAPTGPWTALDQQTFQVTLPRGDSQVPGSFTEASIPGGYYYYHIRLQGSSCASPLDGTTAPVAICTRPTPTSTPNCATGWNVVNSPSVGTADNVLNAVAAVSPADVWAAGTTGLSYTGGQTLVEHWDGSAWSIVGSPNPGTTDNRLNGIAAAAANDVWVTGSQTANGAAQTLTMHWDGSTWTVVPAPNPGSGDNVLGGVVALSPTDLWAVGYTRENQFGPMHTLILHGDGNTWTRVPSPDSALPYNTLTAVAASGPQDVWAVGFYEDTGSNPYTLLEHWDGSTWQIVPSPNPSPVDNILRGVVAISPTDAWAVGTYFDMNGGYRTLTLHWDGSTWSVVPSPSALSGYSYLSAVAGTASDLWATGNAEGNGGQTLLEHWDGSAWSIVGSPNGGAGSDYLVAVAQVGPMDVWAVGRYHDWNNVELTLTEHFTGPCSIATATSTWTATPTPVIIATMTPTPCSITFTDVSPSDYFYQAVTYLYCHGAISGYADNTFWPYNDTTRGQLAKIIVLAEGWPIDTTGGPHFADVPTTHPFYEYIETAYNHGIITGYADNTFRPYHNITRGQLTKVIVLAANWAVTPPSQPTFRDVPTSDPFYGYIETAYSHNVISGYSCGTGCLGFRPGNNATRGQISKIIYLSVTAR